MSYTAVIDYGVGNLFSLCSSLKHLGLEAVVTADADCIRKADRILLPGVGAFGDAISKLRATGLIPVLNEEVAKGKPFLGICLGMQLLFEKGFEYGEHEGLGYLPGEIRDLSADIAYKVPHMGWNALRFQKPASPLLKYITEGDCVYFVHSFYAKDCAPVLIADAEYGVSVPAVVGKDKVFGCQFHPEKSGAVGLRILRAFGEML